MQGIWLAPDVLEKLAVITSMKAKTSYLLAHIFMLGQLLSRSHVRPPQDDAALAQHIYPLGRASQHKYVVLPTVKYTQVVVMVCQLPVASTTTKILSHRHLCISLFPSDMLA